MYAIQDSASCHGAFSPRSISNEIPQFLPLFEDEDDDYDDREEDNDDDREMVYEKEDDLVVVDEGRNVSLKELYDNISVADVEDEGYDDSSLPDV
jgi:hypothetical protein